MRVAGVATIAAIASAPGRSARGIVRLSGPETAAALARVLDPAPAGPGVFTSRFLLSGGRRVPLVALAFAGPRSYTGEDGAELYPPGNPALLERILVALLETEGVRRAEPGEFSLRACLNGKLTIEQAEGVAALISAQSAEELAAANRLARGATGRAHAALAGELAHALALVEAGIDFTDREGVSPIAPSELGALLKNLTERIGALLGPASREARVEEPRVVLVGAPNAGKSTLFNALLDCERSVVSDSPGATRDAIGETLDLACAAPTAPRVRLIDMAGLDAGLDVGLGARSAVDAEAQRAARETIEGADVVILCDPAGAFGPLEARCGGKQTLRVRTKADVPAAGGGAGGGLRVCALDGWNLAALRRAIADAVAGVGGGRGGMALVTPRHDAALRRAVGSLQEASRLVGAQGASATLGSVELVASVLREALDALGEISGRIGPDDIIGRVFARFCVGK